MSHTGAFVQVDSGADGIGKLAELRGTEAVIEYFVSPAGPRVHHVTVPIAELREVELSSQTRVFCFDPGGSAWRELYRRPATSRRQTLEHWRSRGRDVAAA